MNRSFFVWVVIIVVALSSACSSKKPRPEPVIYFSTNITVEGGKFFVYRLEMPARAERGSRPMKGGRPEGGRGGPPQGRDRKSGRGEGDLKQRVDQLIAENRYCRDGYIVLEEFTGAGGVSLRGECRDGATAEDRHRFHNPV
jgi:hypothetical protein